MKDRSYHREYSRNYYHRKRNELIERLGGKCVSCGNVDDLQFDHVDPSTKNFPISKMLNYSWTTVLDEVSKCQLLCGGCHRDKTVVNRDGFQNRARGSAIANSVLSERDVIEIRKLRSDGLTLNELLRLYPNVKKSTMNAVISRTTWKHIV